MVWRVREPLKVFARGASLRRRVAYSLALVRLILGPVIILAIYYLIAMGRIVDRIVSVDAPTATLAERASTEMLDARRAERNYFLLHDPQELQSRVGSLDAQVAATLVAEDPAFGQITTDLRGSSNEFIRLASELERRSWDRIQRDHEQTRMLVRRAEWVLITVSALTLLLSVWVSFLLPSQVVKPLVDLKTAVDHAAAGNYEIGFDVQGEGEVVQLANSVRRLIAHVREKKTNSNLTPAS